MSWTGGLFDFPENTSKEEMMYRIKDDLDENRGRMEPVHQPLVLLKSVDVFSSYEDAEEYLYSEDIVRRYSRVKNVGVRYLDYRNVKPTKKMEDIERRIKETEDKKVKYAAEHSIKKFKSKYIGCQKCGSKLSIQYLSGYSCPLCRADLRSETTINTLKGYDQKIKELNKELLVETKKMKNKAEVWWLVHADAYLG